MWWPLICIFKHFLVTPLEPYETVLNVKLFWTSKEIYYEKKKLTFLLFTMKCHISSPCWHCAAGVCGMQNVRAYDCWAGLCFETVDLFSHNTVKNLNQMWAAATVCGGNTLDEMLSVDWLPLRMKTLHLVSSTSVGWRSISAFHDIVCQQIKLLIVDKIRFH